MVFALLVVVVIRVLVRALALLGVPLDVTMNVALVAGLLAHDHVLVVAPAVAKTVGALLGRLGVHVILAVAVAAPIVVAGRRGHVLGANVHLGVGYVRLAHAQVGGSAGCFAGCLGGGLKAAYRHQLSARGGGGQCQVVVLVRVQSDIIINSRR